MASSRGNSGPSLKDRLDREAYRFDFFQAVRLLELLGQSSEPALEIVGAETLPTHECVRFIGLAARSFAATEIATISLESEIPRMSVAFMGLYGPSGVLPHYDTQRIIDGGTTGNSEKDLLDIFTHRIISLFFRAGTKYRLPFCFERTYRDPSRAEDLFTKAFLSIAGLGSAGVRKRLEIPDEFAIEFCGALGHHPKCAVSLSRILQAYFVVPVRIQQFVGQWLNLSPENQSQMASRAMPLGQNCELGRSYIVGERVWDIQGKFRLLIGPVTYGQFANFLPGSPPLTQFAQAVRLYVGPQLDFDLQFELLATEVPATQLSSTARLGQNTWLLSRPSSVNRVDAIFNCSGDPLSR